MLFCSKLRNFILVQKSILSEFSNPIRSCSKRMPANGVAETVTAYCPPSQYKTAVFCRTAVRSNSWWSTAGGRPAAAAAVGCRAPRWVASHPLTRPGYTTQRTRSECWQRGAPVCAICDTLALSIHRTKSTGPRSGQML